MTPLMNKAVSWCSKGTDSYFETWFQRLPAQVAAKIAVSITRMESGNLSNCKYLSNGIWENKINIGPGFRVYFGRIHKTTLILLCGGTKRTQTKDIAKAQKLWQEFKNSRRYDKCL